jgi:hypothetical protein
MNKSERLTLKKSSQKKVIESDQVHGPVLPMKDCNENPGVKVC